MSEGDAGMLSAADARILALESHVVLGHALKMLVLAPGDPLDVDALRSRIVARLPAFPRALDRIDDSGPAPRWERAETVDIDHHVRRHRAATPAELRRTVDELMSEHLDRSRPLWTIDVIGPLADGREAVAVRIHHAMTDGMGAVRFLDAVLFEPHDAPVHAAGVRPAAPPPPRWREWERLPGVVVREFARPGSRSPFDRPISNRRALAFTALPLSGLREVGRSRAEHATVNDVLLAVIAGGLRRWLGTDHRLPRLRAQVPVSLHRAGEDAASGNRDSFLDVDLLLQEPDDARRLDGISRQTRARKRGEDAVVLDDLFRTLDRVGGLGALARRLADDPREFGVAISNVPGPRVPVSVAGRPVEHLYTSSEPGAHHALRISAISNHEWVGVGFCVDPGAVADVEGLAEASHDAFAALAGTRA